MQVRIRKPSLTRCCICLFFSWCSPPVDCVLVRNVSPQEKNKLKDWWEDIQYLVSECAGNLYVYVVQQKGTGKKRELHHYLLLPYPVPHEKLHTVTTEKYPRQRVQSLEHPDTNRLVNDSDEGKGELEPTVTVTKEKSILDPGWMTHL